jgi:DNA-binding transcriptional regulator GbsR (MarR family)
MGGPLQEAKNLLVRRWGEMGGYWGINRTMAEIHALLFATRQPLCTDDIMEQLKISRGNASMNLRALVDWGLIERVHQLGDRKEYFQADTDVWHMFETIMRERRRREVEPIIATIDRCCEKVEKVPTAASQSEAKDIQEFRRRIVELRRFLAAMARLFELVLQLGDEGTRNLDQLLSPTGKTPPGKAGSRPAKGS